MASDGSDAFFGFDGDNREMWTDSSPFDYGGSDFGSGFDMPDMGFTGSGSDYTDFGGLGGMDFGGFDYSGWGNETPDYMGDMGFTGSSSDYGTYQPDSYDFQGPSSITSFGEPSFLEKLLRRSTGLIPGLPGIAAKVGSAATGNNPDKAMGGLTGSMIGGGIGNAILPGLGGLLGSFLGKSGADAMYRPDNGMNDARIAANSPFVESTGSTGMGGNQPGVDWLGLGTGLAGLYQGNQAGGAIQTARNNNQQQQDFAKQQADQLASMFGPNSSYAQQLRQQLERKDAAGGRRSQYGPREVELQARLAGMASQVAPSILNANKQAMDANQTGLTYAQQGNKTNAQQLNQLMQLAKQSGLLSVAGGGLSDLFKNNAAQATQNAAISAYDLQSAGDSIPSGGGNFWDDWF